MKHSIKTTVILFALAISSISFAQDKKANNIDNSNIALQGYSPVSYLDLGIAQKGLKEYKSEHNKVVYYFTDAEQKKKFEKNPSKYLPQYGGFCAFGVYAGAKFRPDPNKFIVKDGKYFLYLYNLELDAQQLWLAENDHKKLVGTANTNWSKLKNTYN
ncbi:YHS domain-containing (seleno)protein [Flagellimonas sp.]|uniref:YHS domain-containing (seleno)protein n=1 Tax=Flagellimonas sp. TaxID=2058762 RepID=UPI003B50B3FD